jgi:hypothetical protein
MRGVLSWIFGPAPEGSVPVFIDDRRAAAGLALTRCTYFSIESDEPSDAWLLELKKQRIPFLLLGLSGVIAAPSRRRPFFDSPASIDGLFETIESTPGLFVDINDVWLPNDLFGDRPATRGDIYRVDAPLFLKAQNFRVGRLTPSSFGAIGESRSGSLRYSDAETRAFKEWSSGHITAARAKYHADKSRALTYRESA